MTTNPELEDLLMTMALAKIPEVVALEDFLNNDPDVTIKSPLYHFIRKYYESHTHSVRRARLKDERGGQPKATQKSKQAKPNSQNVIIEFEKLFNHLENSDRYIDENGEEKPYYNKTSAAILSFGWDYKTCRSTNQYNEDQELSFLNDMKKLPEHEISDRHKTRLRITARDCLSWLKKKQFTQSHTNGNANGGA